PGDQAPDIGRHSSALRTTAAQSSPRASGPNQWPAGIPTRLRRLPWNGRPGEWPYGRPPKEAPARSYPVKQKKWWAISLLARVPHYRWPRGSHVAWATHDARVGGGL